MGSVVTLKVIREALLRIGKSHSDVARELGVDRTVVQGVLAGRLQGARGDAHKVAVALGLKDGVILAEDTPIVAAVKAMAVA